MTEDEAKRAAMAGDWEAVTRYVTRKGHALPTPESVLVQYIRFDQPRPGSFHITFDLWARRDDVEQLYQWAQSLQAPPRMRSGALVVYHEAETEGSS
jgi:hypothetical protein